MASQTHKKRLAQLESAIQPDVIGVLWFGDEKRVQVGDGVMTLKQFSEVYPGGTLIRVVRVNYGLKSNEEIYD